MPTRRFDRARASVEISRSRAFSSIRYLSAWSRASPGASQNRQRDRIWIYDAVRQATDGGSRRALYELISCGGLSDSAIGGAGRRVVG
ncbi:hypothetical protein BMJ22_14450 [Sinorhizobium medicae]|nr:hypothetical protein BMJ22_14450 [Sinorhizobium medicae]